MAHKKHKSTGRMISGKKRPAPVEVRTSKRIAARQTVASVMPDRQTWGPNQYADSSFRQMGILAQVGLLAEDVDGTYLHWSAAGVQAYTYAHAQASRNSGIRQFNEAVRKQNISKHRKASGLGF